jgi:very-short-patch-repair endonuclease
MNLVYILLFIVLVGVFILRVWSSNSEPSSAKHSGFSYKRKQFFFTRSENDFFGLLQRTLEGRNLIVFPKVRVADVLNRISQKHVDFLLVSLPDFQPVMAIELDGKSHGSQKQQARDAIKDQVFKSAGVPLVRVPVSRDLSDVMLLSILEPHLKPTPVQVVAKSLKTGSARPSKV